MNNKNVNSLRSCLAVLLAFALIISCLIPSVSVYADDSDPVEEAAEEATLRDGVYEGKGEGRNGDIIVSVTVDGGVISGIEVLSQQETPEYWEDASEMLAKYTGKTSSDDVDAVSGATRSSEGIRAAVNDALKKASGDAAEIGGSGTEKDPYVINNADQLQFFAEKIDEGDSAYTGAYAVLGDDIDLSGVESWNPIGAEGKASSNKTKLFAGTFNGRGRTVSCMKISGEYDAEANIGLFSTLAGTAKVSNVVMKAADIDVACTGDMTPIRAGILAGDTQSGGTLIDGCSVSGNVSVTANTSSAFGGGILGRSMRKTVIINCMSDADVNATSIGAQNAAYAGGIIGMSGNDNVMANCGSTGNTSATNESSSEDSYAGGIAGMLSSKTYNVYSLGNAAITKKESEGKKLVGITAGQAAGSSSGGLIYYAEDASVTVNGQDSESAAYGENIGQIKPEDFVGMKKSSMSGEAFTDILNGNIRSVNEALADYSFEMREWTVAEGEVVLSDSVWVPGEIDAGIFESGTGTREDPYMISTADQLRAFAGSFNSKIDYRDKFIKLGDDLDISGEDWAPAGGSFYRFDGDFDGNGKVITGLTEGTEDKPVELDAASAYIGLFGWINEHARIHNLTLDNVAIYTHSTGSAYVGGITGRMSGTDTEGNYHGAGIDSCVVKGVIDHTTDKGTSFIGGITGHMFKGTVINSMTDMNVTAKELSGELAEVGGVVGLLNRGLIANSYALGKITGSGYRDTQYDIEGMACVGNIAAVNGGYIANCYGQGDVEALEYSIDTGIITGWVTGIAKVYDCWYNEDASMRIDGRDVSPVDPFGETVAGGVSDEWGFRFPGSLLENNNGYHPEIDASKVADGLNSSFEKFPIDIEGIFGLSDDSLKTWTVRDGQAVLGGTRAKVTYVQPEVEKNLEEEPETVLLDGTWYGRSQDKATVVSVNVRNGEVTSTSVLSGDKIGEAYEEAVKRAKFKARFGDTSDYEPADTSRFKGSGTEKDPYKVETEAQLRYLASSINEDVDWQGKYFEQTRDITVSGKDWDPIGWGIFADADDDGFGQDVVALYPFRGIYDGGNHSVKGLKVGSASQPATENYMGLFGIVQGDYTSNEIPENGYCAELKNIRVEDVSFYTENRWRSYIGGLVGNAQGGFAIDNCSVTGTVNARSTEDFAYAGGLSGSLMYGSVTDTFTNADSSSWSGKNYSYAAGMSAVTNRATIVDCAAAGDVHADADQTNRAEAGGFIGLDGGVCINCYARGSVEIVSKYSMYLGGFVGMAASSSEHRQCYYNIDASQKVAGNDVSEKRYAGKFVNESAEANAQAQSGEMMASEDFVKLLEDNRKKLAETLSQVRKVLGADGNGNSRYHSVYYNGDGSDLSPWGLYDGVVRPAVKGAAVDETDDKGTTDSGEKTDPADGQKDQGTTGSDNKTGSTDGQKDQGITDSGKKTDSANTQKDQSKTGSVDELKNQAKTGNKKTEAQIAAAKKAAAEAKAKKIKTVTVNTKTVNRKAIDKAIKKAGGSKKYVTKIVLGKKVRKITKGTLAKYKRVRTITIKSRKLRKKTVKGSLRKSKVRTIRVKVGKKSMNRKYARKYRKYFTLKNAGKKVAVKY